MAVKRQPRLQAKGVPRAKTDGLCTAGNQLVPEENTVFTQRENLVTNRFPRVPGLGNMHGFSAEFYRAERVLYRFGQKRAVRHIA